MSKSGRKQKTTHDKSKVDSYVWTDDEVELLLKITNEYKVSKAMENIDWESCQTKYSDIFDLYLEQYPSTKEDAEKLGKEYYHKKEELNKGIVTTKLKNIRLKFRQAVDSGRRSGHGRVVLLYFELCEYVWGGSPAITTISAGIETAEIESGVDSSLTDTAESPASPESIDTLDLETSDIAEATPGYSKATTSTNERRDLLNAKLKGYKKEKLKRKLSVESQLLSVTQEEFKIKKQLLDRMDSMDKEYSNHMNKMTSNMEKLTGSIADGFAMLRQVMLQPYGMPQQYPQTQAGYPNMYPVHSTPARVPVAPMNTTMPDSNNGHFSYTQSLFSDDRDNSF